MTQRFSSPEALVDSLLEKVGKQVVLALPLGLGKPCHIVNALVERALADPSLQLEIFTALTLEVPRGGSALERRFMEPARKRLFGDYPALVYNPLRREGRLPENIRVKEFFFLAGKWLGVPGAQASHISANYTHVLQYMIDTGANVLAQLVGRRQESGETRYSLSSNTDLSIDLLAARKNGRADFLVAAQANSEMPFMMGDAIVEEAELDLLLDSPETDFELFSVPRRPITNSDQAIGLHAARLVQDGGTLQVGIGSVGDAVSAALILRHQQNPAFRELIEALSTGEAGRFSDCAPFTRGLYASSEMFVHGLLELVEHGVIRREVDGALVHAGFFVESRDFYRRLNAMSDEERNRFQMTSVSFTNQLYIDEAEKRAARVKACFINNAMKATLLGAVISDGLENGAVVSGVGGQFNFVTQAFALEGARSVLTLAATRLSKGRLESNIVWSFAHETIPRHLRDIIITEYGIADLRGKTDAEVVAAMLSVADSRFQPQLLQQAKSAGKIAADYEIPKAFQQNIPERINAVIDAGKAKGLLSVFPFGTEFTQLEQDLLPALDLLGRISHSRLEMVRLMLAGWGARKNQQYRPLLQRLQLDQSQLKDTGGLRAKIYQLLVAGALARTMPAKS